MTKTKKMLHLSIHTTTVPSHTHNSQRSNNSDDNNHSRTNMQCILPPPPQPRGILTTLSIILMTLTTMTIISSINNNNNDIVTTVFTPVAAEGGYLNDQYLPYAYPVDCCAYELSGTSEVSFPALPLLLVDPSDTSNYGNTFFWPAGSRQIVPRKLNSDTKNANSTNSNIDDGNSDSEPKCSSTNFSLWYGYFDRYFPRVPGWTLNEWNTPPVKGEPIHIENNDIWATSIISTNYRYEVSGRLVKVDLECTPPLLSVPPQQNCVLLWLGSVDGQWRHKYGGDQCMGARTTIVPPMPSNSTFHAYVSSISLLMMMISLQLMWHIIL